jgi:MIP family channel proteins
MTRQEMRCCAAEFLGTFALLFFGCGSIVLMGRNGGVAGHLGVNVVFGATVAAMIYALGHVSCAHFNPAVTLGFTVMRRFPRRLVVPYLLAQIGGALAACATLSLVLPAPALTDAQWGATVPAFTRGQAAGIEIVLTFFLMLVIAAVATDERVPAGIAGAAIGLTVLLCGLMGGLVSGCSMNPARSLAPAVFAGGAAFHSLWIYLLAPVVGAVFGALTYEALRAPQTRRASCPPSCCLPE